MKVLVAMSGGVDSSVAAALLAEAGHRVVGVTMKLWGGPSDQGCCSVADVEDARRVADRLGIDHHVFNFAEDFAARVVQPYVDAHARGETPNPCVECNRHLKFDRLVHRAVALGFDAIATGHHARVAVAADGRRRVRRGVDAAKDQSYVLYMLGPDVLARLLLPVGDLTKSEVRRRAAGLGLVTADKADSQDVCFIRSRSGRAGFLGERMALRPARVVDRRGVPLGAVPAVQLVTIGQRRGLGGPGGGAAHYVLDVDVASAVVTVGARHDLDVAHQRVERLSWSADPAYGELSVQTSAHGRVQAATVEDLPDDREGDDVRAGGAPAGGGPGDDRARRVLVRWREPQRRVAPGQAVVLYRDDLVVGGGLAV